MEGVKMKLFVKLVFSIGFLFLGGGFLLAFLQYIAYNGFGDIFEYVMLACLEMHVETDSVKEREIILYKYVIDKKLWIKAVYLYTNNSWMWFLWKQCVL